MDNFNKQRCSKCLQKYFPRLQDPGSCIIHKCISTYLSLWGVLRGVHAGVVKTSVRPGDLAVLAIGVIEVGHSPAVLLVLVVVGVGGAVLGRGDALSVGGGLAVVEVHLGAGHVTHAGGELLA